jgi:hypothetical protein
LALVEAAMQTAPILFLAVLQPLVVVTESVSHRVALAAAETQMPRLMSPEAWVLLGKAMLAGLIFQIVAERLQVVAVGGLGVLASMAFFSGPVAVALGLPPLLQVLVFFMLAEGVLEQRNRTPHLLALVALEAEAPGRLLV